MYVKKKKTQMSFQMLISDKKKKKKKTSKKNKIRLIDYIFVIRNNTKCGFGLKQIQIRNHKSVQLNCF